MPENYRIGATSSTGVSLLQPTIYKSPAASWSHHVEHDSVLVPMIGGHPALPRHRESYEVWDLDIFNRRATGHQERLNDFAAIRTQLALAADFSLGDSGTPIYLWEQWGNQTNPVQYLIIRGWFVEEKRLAGGAALYIVGRLHLDTRVAGV